MNFKIWTLKWLEPLIFSLLQNLTIPNKYKALFGESNKVDDMNILYFSHQVMKLTLLANHIKRSIGFDTPWNFNYFLNNNSLKKICWT